MSGGPFDENLPAGAWEADFDMRVLEEAARRERRKARVPKPAPVPESPPPGDLSAQAREQRASAARILAAHVRAGTALPQAGRLIPEPEPILEEPDEPQRFEPPAAQLDMELHQLRLSL